MKTQLTEQLIGRMREKFMTETKDNMKAMDVLGQEVVKFMATSASMKAEDLNRLEDQIRFKLAGSSGLTLTAEQIAAARKEAYRAKKMQDPWVAMAEFEIEQSVKEAFMRKEMEATEKLHVKHTLDIQLQEKDALKHRAKLRDMEYAAEEQRALEMWHAQEQTKMEEEKQVRAHLNQDRAAQIADKEMRKARAVARQKQEELEAKEMMRVEHMRALELETKKKQAIKVKNEQFKQDNAKQLELLADLKLRDMAEDEKYRQLAIEDLDKREKARNKLLKDFEDKQKEKMDLVARETKPRQLKRYIDESTIEVNFQQREKLLDKQEEEKQRRVVEKNVEMRRVLAAQLREKEWRRKQMADEEATRFGIFKQSLAEAQAADALLKPDKGIAQRKVRAELDQQLREKAMRESNPTMSEIEKVLNLPILKRLEQQKALKAMGQ